MSSATYPPKPDECAIQVIELEPAQLRPPDDRSGGSDSGFSEYVAVGVSQAVDRPHDILELFERTAGAKGPALLDEARRLACRAGADALVFQPLPPYIAKNPDDPPRPRARGWVIRFHLHRPVTVADHVEASGETVSLVNQWTGALTNGDVSSVLALTRCPLSIGRFPAIFEGADRFDWGCDEIAALADNRRTAPPTDAIEVRRIRAESIEAVWGLRNVDCRSASDTLVSVNGSLLLCVTGNPRRVAAIQYQIPDKSAPASGVLFYEVPEEVASVAMEWLTAAFVGFGEHRVRTLSAVPFSFFGGVALERRVESHAELVDTLRGLRALLELAPVRVRDVGQSWAVRPWAVDVVWSDEHVDCRGVSDVLVWVTGSMEMDDSVEEVGGFMCLTGTPPKVAALSSGR